MSFDMYNPYKPQQPINGLLQVNGIKGAEMYYLPPNSVSPPLFLDSDNIFYIKKTDAGGASSISRYRFELEPEPEQTAPGSAEFVTKDYFDNWANKIMEAINGQHTVPGQPETE